MSQAFDLDCYFQRIDYRGTARPTLSVLRDLIRHHMAQIPFEGIDVLMNRGIRIDAAGIVQKLVAEKRGGYCFEQTGLMRLALEQIGFPVQQHLARVWLRRNPASDTPGAATHTSLKVEADGRLWLVDVGFGSFMPVEPIAWQTDTPTVTGWGSYRLVKTGNGLLLSSQHEGEWRPLYEILDFNWQPIDFVIANHYVATHPDSHFRHDLNLARTTAGERRTIAGNVFRRTTPDGTSTTEILDAAGLATSIEREFGLVVQPQWQPMLQSFAAGRIWNDAELQAKG